MQNIINKYTQIQKIIGPYPIPQHGRDQQLCKCYSLIRFTLIWTEEKSPYFFSDPIPYQVSIASCGLSEMHHHWLKCKRIFKSLSKFHSLNHHLESHVHKNRPLYIFTLQQFLYILFTLQRVIFVIYLWLARNPEQMMAIFE